MKLFGDDLVARKAKKELDEYFDGRKRLTHKEFHFIAKAGSGALSLKETKISPRRNHISDFEAIAHKTTSNEPEVATP